MRFLLQGYAASPCAALAWTALEGDGVPSAQRHSEELPQPRYSLRKRLLFPCLLRCRFILKLIIILPRQARDKHKERALPHAKGEREREMRVSAGIWEWVGPFFPALAFGAPGYTASAADTYFASEQLRCWE